MVFLLGLAASRFMSTPTVWPRTNFTDAFYTTDIYTYPPITILSI